MRAWWRFSKYLVLGVTLLLVLVAILWGLTQKIGVHHAQTLFQMSNVTAGMYVSHVLKAHENEVKVHEKGVDSHEGVDSAAKLRYAVQAQTAVEKERAISERLMHKLKKQSVELQKLQRQPTPSCRHSRRPPLRAQPWEVASEIESAGVGSWASTTGVFVFGNSIDRFWVNQACAPENFNGNAVDPSYLCERLTSP